MNNEKPNKFNGILTIDGIGRAKKAKKLLELLELEDIEFLKEELKKMMEFKY